MKIEEVLKHIIEYQEKYRNSDLKDFEISPIYDLFPDKNTNKEFQEWPETYKHNGRYGVYLIIDNDFDVIYIGESSNIGKRLGDYFGYCEDKSCLIKHNNWSKKPRYICSIAVQNHTWFERLSLEEYLIYTTKPTDNIKSK